MSEAISISILNDKSVLGGLALWILRPEINIVVLLYLNSTNYNHFHVKTVLAEFKGGFSVFQENFGGFTVFATYFGGFTVSRPPLRPPLITVGKTFSELYKLIVVYLVQDSFVVVFTQFSN